MDLVRKLKHLSFYFSNLWITLKFMIIYNIKSLIVQIGTLLLIGTFTLYATLHLQSRFN